MIIAESNLGFEASWLLIKMRELEKDFKFIREDDYIFMFEDISKKTGYVGPGVRTDNELKEQMTLLFEQDLVYDRFKFHKDFFTVTDKSTKRQMQEEILNQMRDFSKIEIKRKKSKYAKPTVIYSGKSGYGKDDIMMSLLIGRQLSKLFLTNKEKYGHYWPVLGQ